MGSKNIKHSVSALVIVAMITSLFALPIMQKDEVYGATKKYKVTYNRNGGKFEATKYKNKKKIVKKITSGKKLGKTPKVKKSGYAFLGWYTKKSGGKKYTKSTKIKKNVKLYARYTKKFTKKTKYTKYLGREYSSTNAAMADASKDFGTLSHNNKIIDEDDPNSDGDISQNYDDDGKLESTDYYFNNENTGRCFSLRIYADDQGAKPYTLDWISVMNKDVVNITKTYDYKIFMKKMGISKYTYSKKWSELEFTSNRCDWWFYAPKGKIKPSDFVSIQYQIFV